eukprot:scpid78989/ scgid34005/ 
MEELSTEESPLDRSFAALLCKVEAVLFTERLPAKMTDLTAFLNSKRETADADHSELRADTVKEKLRRHFVDRVNFARPDSRNESEIVYATEHSQQIIANLFSQTSKEQESESESYSGSDHDDSDSSSAASTRRHERLVAMDEVRIVYHAARILRNKMSDHAAAMDKEHQSEPTALTPDEGAKSVPGLLHNFLVWAMNTEYDMDIVSEKVRIEDAALQRMLPPSATDCSIHF